MNILATKSGNSDQSPFDQIKRIDENNNEYWLARELMPLLGYAQWRQFSDAIERAILSQTNSGNPVSQHFLRMTAKTSGRPQEEYKLSRYACYLTAMNGDPRKEQIAQAQSYFVAKTREAEVLIPLQSDRIKELELENENLKLRNENIKLQENFMKKSEAIATLHGVGMLALIQGRSDAVVEKKEIITESVICVEGRQVSFIGKSTAEMGKELGFKTGKDFQHWLERQGHGHLICQGMRAIQSEYVPEENIKAVRELWLKAKNNGTRQLLLGENS